MSGGFFIMSIFSSFNSRPRAKAFLPTRTETLRATKSLNLGLG
jgi:hypothetical protein